MTGDLVRIGIWLLAGVFAVSGSVKVASPSGTAVAMVRFGLLRSPSAGVARAVGGGELVLAMLIAALADTGAPLAAAAVALIGLSVLIATALIRGERFPCGCFGPSNEPLSYWSLLRNGLLILLCASLLLVYADHPSYLAVGSLRDEILRTATASSLLATSFLVVTFSALFKWNAAPTQVRQS